MSWDGPGHGQDREDRWARSERWSDRAESYREFDTPGKSARVQRENARFQGNCLTALGLPFAGWLAHLVEHALGEHGVAWELLWFGVLVGLALLVGRAWNRWL
jgi:hypothetical protein